MFGFGALKVSWEHCSTDYTVTKLVRKTFLSESKKYSQLLRLFSFIKVENNEISWLVQISKNLFSFLKCNDTFIQKAILYAKSLIFLQLPAKQIKREKEMTHKTLFFAQIYLPFVDTLATKNAMQYIVQCTKFSQSFSKS